jgi:hypothetical protein
LRVTYGAFVQPLTDARRYEAKHRKSGDQHKYTEVCKILVKEQATTVCMHMIPLFQLEVLFSLQPVTDRCIALN